jgi:hypothetical protein
MSAPSRRRFLAAGAGLLAAGATVADAATSATSPGPALRHVDFRGLGLTRGQPDLLACTNPDAALIALCAEHIVNRATFNSGIEPNGDGPYWDAYCRTYNAICEAKPQTILGVLAKARAAKDEAQEPDGTEEPHGVPNEWAWDLVNDLIRLTGGATT